jgi:hypothetical protein
MTKHENSAWKTQSFSVSELQRDGDFSVRIKIYFRRARFGKNGEVCYSKKTGACNPQVFLHNK